VLREAEKPPGEAQGGVLISGSRRLERAEKRSPIRA
jgi:hypothetical protein